MQEAALAEERAASTQTEPAGLVRMTAVPAFAVRHVLPALTEFNRRFPKIRVNLSCSNRTLDLGDEGFDLGIRVAFSPAPNLVARKLTANRSVLCASPAYLERLGTPRRVEEPGGHECVLFPPLAPKGIWTLSGGQQQFTVAVGGRFQTDDMDAVRELIDFLVQRCSPVPPWEVGW